jgi:hypothetical protein
MISDRPSAEEVQKDRQSVYGNPYHNMAGTSQQIAGILTQMLANGQMKIDAHGIVSLPGWAAPLLMAAVKINRAASGVPHDDNFLDAEVYLGFAADMQKVE